MLSFENFDNFDELLLYDRNELLERIKTTAIDYDVDYITGGLVNSKDFTNRSDADAQIFFNDTGNSIVEQLASFFDPEVTSITEASSLFLSELERMAVPFEQLSANMATTVARNAANEFNIEVRFIDNSLTSSQRAIFTSAANRWEQIIVGDIPDAFVGGIGFVDDLVIEASAPFIDGRGGILGQAGPTWLRQGSLLPIAGEMEFDSADVAQLESVGQLDEVILHEMGHVLGIGTIWRSLGLLRGASGSNPRYVGRGAVREYNRIFGRNLSSVPVENRGGPGTRNGHWRESVFDNELMTGFLNFGQENPISRITVASLGDLGYDVNLGAADPYSPPSLNVQSVDAVANTVMSTGFKSNLV